MGIDVSTLEPAERNPAELRRTARWILLAAVLGGVIVTWAYRVKSSGDGDRPAIVTRLESNLAALNQDGEAVDIGQLDGKIWLATSMALSQPEVSADSLAAMREIEEAYTSDEVAKFVCFTVDPANDTPEKLAEFARGLGVTSDRWWFLAAGEEPVRGYLRDQMQLGSVSTVKDEREGTSRLVFHSLVGVFDRYRHLRGPRYDFREARLVSESAQKFMREEPERAEEMYQDIGVRPEEHVDDLEEAKERLRAVIDHILDEDLLEEGKKEQ